MLGKARTPATAATPVPVKDTALALPPAVTLSVAVALPVAVGLKLRPSVHVPLAATAAVQPLVSTKTLAALPDSAAEVTDKAVVPVFFRVTFWTAAVVPTVCDAKLNVVGVNV